MGGAETRRDWRDGALRTTLSWALVLGGLLAALAVVMASTEQRRSAPFWGMIASYTLLYPLRFAPLRRSVRSWGFVLALIVQGEAGVSQAGFQPGAILVLSLSVVVAGIFLGRAGLITALIASTAGLVAVGLAITGGVLPAPPGALADAARAEWLRASLGYGLVAGVIAVLVSYAIARLREAETALEANRRIEALGLLAGGVAHDFNNALQVVRAWSQLLRRDATDRQREGLDAIDGAAERAAQLTTQLLAVSRRDAWTPEPVALEHLVSSWSSSLRRLVPEDIEVRLELDDTGIVRADPAQLERVLLNLVANAADAMGSRGIVTISVAEVDVDRVPDAPPEPARWVRLSVADDGPGMDRSVRERLFEPFFTTKRAHGGTGLGLAIVLSAVERNHGLLYVDTAPGRGARFDIYFPVASAATAGDDDEPEARDDDGRLEGMVLLAEDEAMLRKALARYLTNAGLEVIEAEDGDGAMAIVNQRATSIDVMCVDGVMPGCPTGEVVDRYLEQHPGGRVLVCSGHLPEELLRRDLTAARYRFLAKPFPPAELVAQLRELLD